MQERNETTLIMVDDNVDEIFLTRRQVRRDGIVNRFVSEQKPENLFETLGSLKSEGKSNVLVLLDVAMPRTDGMELLRQLRAHPDYSDVPVIMLSASSDHGDKARALELGADGYIVKPFKADIFFEMLRNVPTIRQCLVR